MKLNVIGGVIAVLAFAALVVAYGALFTVYQTQQALVVRLGQPVHVVGEPGLHVKVPFIDSVIDIDKRILDLEAPAQEVIASDQKRLVVDAFARYRIQDPLRFYQTLGSIQGANSQLAILLNSALRRVLGEVTFTHVVRDQRAELMARIRDLVDTRQPRLRHLGGRRADPARRPAGAEQPGGLSAHADRAPARGGGIPRAGRAARAGNPLARRPRGDRAGGRGDLASPSRSAARATPPQPDLRRRLQQGPGLLRVLPLDAGLRDRPQAQRHAASCSSRTPASSASSTIRPASCAWTTAPPPAAPAAPARQASTERTAGMWRLPGRARAGLRDRGPGVCRLSRRRPSGRWRACWKRRRRRLRAIGIGSAVIGLILVWLVAAADRHGSSLSRHRRLRLPKASRGFRHNAGHDGDCDRRCP